MASINGFIDRIRTAIHGREVRGSLADGLIAVNSETEMATRRTIETEQRQNQLETRYDVAVSSHTEYSEVEDARVDANGNRHVSLKNRLDSEQNGLIDITNDLINHTKDDGRHTTNGNADTATRLQSPRTFTIGDTSRSFDGTANVTWSLPEIGAAVASNINAANNHGVIISDGFAINWGVVSFAASANVTQSVTVGFGVTFRHSPTVIANPRTGFPNTVSASVADITATSCDVFSHRTTNVAYSVGWVAVGAV